MISLHLINMDLYNYFDKVIILSLIKDKEKRLNMENQCMDIFKQKYPYHDAVIFPHNSSIMQGFNTLGTGRFRKANEIGCAMEHYRIIKKAYESGLKNIFVMEDDIAFIKDIDYMKRCLDNTPDNWDILMMSSYIGLRTDKDIDLLKESESVNDYWFVPFWPGWCTACYALSRKGMQYYLKSQDKFFQVADMPLYNALYFKDNKKLVNTYFTKKPLAIQKDLLYSSDIRNREEIIEKKKWNLYEKNIDEKDYFLYDNK